jgi:hypothetical protein
LRDAVARGSNGALPSSEGGALNSSAVNTCEEPRNYVNVDECRFIPQTICECRSGWATMWVRESKSRLGKSRSSARLPRNRSVDARERPLYSVAGSRSEGIDAHP